MNGNTNERPPVFIAPETLADRFARGGVVFGSRPAGEDAVPLRAGVVRPGPGGMVYIRPTDRGDWRPIGTLVDDGITISQTVEQPDILEQIDRATENLCPCGAEPSEGFAPYCSYDCKPTHHARHTISDRDGTEMRWRPDLVSEVDDTGLVPYLQRTRHGRFFVEVFQRPGAEVLHVRLDDDHRWVGADVPRLPAEDFAERYGAKLTALVRELENDRHVVPAQPERRQPAYCGILEDQASRMRAHRAHWSRAAPVAREGHIHWVNPAPDRATQLASALRALGVSLAGVGPAVRSLFGRPADPPRPRPTAEQREETLRRVREARNSGPQPPRRAPRSIDPRHGR